MRRERKKIARLHFLSNENLFLPFSFHPARRLFNFMQGSGSGEGRGAFEFQVCFVGDSGKVLFFIIFFSRFRMDENFLNKNSSLKLVILTRWEN